MSYVLLGLKYVSYLLGLGSVIGIFFSLGYDFKRLQHRFKLSQSIRYKTYTTDLLKYKLLRQYNHLLSSGWTRYQYQYFAKVLTVQAIAFLTLLLISSFAMQSLTMGIMTAGIFAYVFPAAVLYIRHKSAQHDLRKDIVNSIIILLQSYQKNQFNMIYALKEVTENVEGNTQVAYSKLFARMHESDEIKELAAETFAYQLSYFRGNNLAITILKACKDGVNVESVLRNTVEDITELKKRVREGETEARETRLISFFPLPLFGIFAIANEFYFFADGSSLTYQFGTPLGLKSFIITLFFGLLNFGLGIMVKKPKQM